jgi:putative flippase GtrA
MRKHIKKALNTESIRFATIGALNTFIDFTILNILVSGLGFERIPANVVSASTAMIFSYFANRHLVFRSQSRQYHKQMTLFIAGTLFGIYVLQNGTIYLLTEVWLWPVNLAVSLATHLGLNRDVSRDFIITNSAKIAATLVSMVWNYIYYKKVVFKE